MNYFIIFAVAALSCWAAPLTVKVDGFLLAVDKDGDEQLLESETVKPGDVVVYEIKCRNVSEYPVAGGVIEVPIPTPSSYVADSATHPTELTFSCSIDGGETFYAEPIRISKKDKDGNDVPAIAGAARYTHLRWELPQLEPKKSVEVSFRSEVQKGVAITPQSVAVEARVRPAGRALPKPKGPVRDRQTVLAWPVEQLPMLTEGKWLAPGGWADQFPAKVNVTGEGVRIDFSSQGAAATRWSKAVASCRLRQRLENTQVIALDIFSSLPGPAQLALGLQSNVFVESTPVAIRPGLNKNVMFDLQARNYKSEASNWAYRTALQPKVSVHELNLIFYPQQSTGTFEIRGTRIHTPPK